MIIRSWNAVATEAGSRAFVQYFTSTALPHLQELDGFLGAYLLDRDGGDLVGLSVLTLWESLEALAAHTGLDADVAIIAPEAIAALLDFDSEVTHDHVAARMGATTVHTLHGGGTLVTH